VESVMFDIGENEATGRMTKEGTMYLERGL
jgi:hypothetical protein